MSHVLIIGGGPSGLASAYELVRHGAQATVLERLSRPGGLSRTIPHAGCLFDIGPHRFFTKNEEVRQLVLDVVAEDLLRVPRLTRIYYRKKFFDYPLKPMNALFGVGLLTSLAVLGSFGQAKLARMLAPREPANFEEWTTDQFGRRLFETFFQTYTEKVWGIPCTQIGAEWAGQRIKGLNLTTALLNSLFPPKSGTVKTLVDEFIYPRLGAGQFYEKLGAVVARDGGQVQMQREVVRVQREGMRVRSATVRDAAGHEAEIQADWFLSSAPLTELITMLDPPPPDVVLAACRSLRYRDHISVQLKFSEHLFPDNWIYVHARDVAMARICDYRNFSPAMAENDSVSPLTVEYFTFKGDAVWNRSDDELLALAAQEIAGMGLAGSGKLLSGFVVRNEKAYPVIELGYQRHVETIKSWLDGLENLLPIGRAGMFKYNNQDHAIATGLLAARTVLGLGRFDPWRVNIDAEYHEAGKAQ